MLRQLIIVFCFFSLFSFSQNQSANWFFEQNGGITFYDCDDAVASNTSGRIITDQVGPSKGNSALSDKYGNLLFYSDSRTVWGANHQALPNANMEDGTSLKGHRNSIILPQPGSDNLFYIFTIDLVGPNNIDDDGAHSGLNYSIIDLDLRGGLGDVINNQKNTELITFIENDPEESEIKVSDLLTVVRGSDCNSYWIITHFQSNFYAFLFDDNGVNPNPIISSLPPLIQIVSFANGSNFYTGADVLKTSPNGNKIAVAHRSYYLLDSGNLGLESEVYIYDFDNTSGIFSNPNKLIMGNTDDYLVFGLEFSASGRFLYGNARVILNEGTSASDFSSDVSLFRWDLNGNNISQSNLIYESDNVQFTSMQLGLDDRIYLLNLAGANETEFTRYLGVISNPDSGGNININNQAVLVDSNGDFNNTAIGSLPQINRQWFNTNISLVDDGRGGCELSLCGTESRYLTAINIMDADYTWFKDGVEILGEDEFRLLVSEVGFYEVFVEPNDGRCPFEGFASVTISNDFPSAIDASIFQCDEDGINDGITLFNFNPLFNTITNNEPNRGIKYYENLTDAENEENQILNTTNYNNTSNPQTIIASVINLDSGCRAYAEVTLEVSITNSNDTLLNGCDTDDIQDGIGEFTLSDADASILQGLPSELTVTYHETYENALSKLFILQNNYTNTVPYNQTIYARVEDGFNCYGISEVDLEVFPSPNIETEFETIYCLNTFPEKITLTGGVLNDIPSNYYYEWSTGETTQNIEVNAPGVYTVTVTNVDGCSKERTITVLASNIATINDVQITDVTTDNIVTILASGEGNYEFALNNPDGPYQDNNTFDNLSPGFYTVFVRDKNGCGIIEDIISVVGFPKFFTPNGDGQNDFWQIKGLSSTSIPNEPIFVFDRYGKLLTEINPTSNGWNGDYNGNPMPSSDYWFTVTLQDGRRFSSHFTLKR